MSSPVVVLVSFHFVWVIKCGSKGCLIIRGGGYSELSTTLGSYLGIRYPLEILPQLLQKCKFKKLAKIRNEIMILSKNLRRTQKNTTVDTVHHQLLRVHCTLTVILNSSFQFWFFQLNFVGGFCTVFVHELHLQRRQGPSSQWRVCNN